VELEFALLGLIKLHPGATGYELNRMLKASTGYFLSTSLSRIYPTLKKLHARREVTFKTTPLKNRPSKKAYQITKKGDEVLQRWLKEPIRSSLDLKPFFLKMSFAPLMTKKVLLRHIDREIAYREGLQNQAPGRGIFTELDYLDKERFDPKRAEALWGSIYQIHVRTEELRLAWLREWRRNVHKGLR
jgi:DNA-binding PadR family transcriptional regulator